MEAINNFIVHDVLSHFGSLFSTYKDMAFRKIAFLDVISLHQIIISIN